MNKYSCKLCDGITARFIDDPKFKTTTLSVNITRPLSRNEVTLNALLPSVLRRATKTYPSTKALNIYLDELYGASGECVISKRGDAQIISFIFKTVADRYAPDVLPFRKIIGLAGEILFNPYTENGIFSREYTDREKENLKSFIEGVINDKREFAKKRLIENMYKDELFGIFEYGYIEDLDDITAEALFSHYKKVMSTSPIDLIITGPCNRNEIIEELTKVFAACPSSPIPYPVVSAGLPGTDITYINDCDNVTQGKLCIGLRTPVTIHSQLYYATMVMNNLFGGATHSKLFMNVREKLSLAYYAGSAYNSFKGLVMVNCGIEFDKYQLTLDEIMNQLEEIKKGNITDDEITFSKLALTNSYKSLTDSAGAINSMCITEILSDTDFSLEEAISKINSVCREEICEAANMLKPDTVYFLKGRE